MTRPIPPVGPGAIPELGIYLLGGRVTDPGRALVDIVDAERLGLSSAWIAERFDQKELAVLCGAMAARTSHIHIGTGSIAAGSRHPVLTAATGSTFAQVFGDRLLMGLAKGLSAVLDAHGMPTPTMAGFEDYARILLDLWDGKTVAYDGPAGRYPNARLVDPPTAPRPPIFYSSWVPGPRAIAAAARTFDGILLGTELTVEATGVLVGRIRQECERIGRDPSSLAIYTMVMVAPDLSDDDVLALIRARMITHLGFPGVGDLLVAANGWDQGALARIMGLDELAGEVIADQRFTREQLLEAAAAIPDDWVDASCAVGPADYCVKRLREYVDAGVDHIILHGSSPAQLAETLRIWKT